MKIYLENYKPDLLKKKMKSFEKYLHNESRFIEVLSEEGLFTVDNQNIFKINITHDESYKLEYDKYSLLIDKSKTNLEKIFSVPTHNYLCIIKKNIYKLNSKSDVEFIIEGENDKDNNFIPTNFYFNAPDTKEFIFLKEDLNVFLSLLN